MVTKKPKGLGRGLEALLGPKVNEAFLVDGSPLNSANPGWPSVNFLRRQREIAQNR